MARWTAEQIGDQTGKIVIVTGANSGIGYETARQLADRGAEVILACRNPERGNDAVARIQDAHPHAVVRFLQLDLADVEQIKRFVKDFRAEYEQLDILINNAGIMMCPESTTAQGHESQFGVNHLGHFTLTVLLGDVLRDTPKARVVNVSSLAHRFGKMCFDDLSFETRSYSKMAAYAQSKLANMLFTFELQRRLSSDANQVTVAAAHPGWTSTNLQKHSLSIRAFNPLFGMSSAKGALPTLRAAVAPDVCGGDYYGPSGLFEIWGTPNRAKVSKRATRVADAARLWAVSESLTGVTLASRVAEA